MLELTGYGLRLVLNHPAQLGRLAPEHAPAADTAILARPAGDGQKVLIAPGESAGEGEFERVELQEAGMQGWVLQQDDDGARVVLGEADSLGDLAEVHAGPADRSWSLASSKGYAGPWPEGYNLLTTDEDTTWPFELAGHDGSLMYVRGPMPADSLPDADDLAVGDQRLIRDDSDAEPACVELGYDHDGQEWRLSYHFATLGNDVAVAVCCQAPAADPGGSQAQAQRFANALQLNA